MFTLTQCLDDKNESKKCEEHNIQFFEAGEDAAEAFGSRQACMKVTDGLPATSSHLPQSRDQRFYSTTLTLANGKAATILGGTPASIVSRSIEVYEPGTGTWDPPIALPATFDYLYYPWA